MMLRPVIRSLWRRRTTSAFILGSLVLGLGLNLAIFGLTAGLVRGPDVGVPEDRLMRVSDSQGFTWFGERFARELRLRTDLAMDGVAGAANLPVSVGDEATELRGRAVTGNYFSLLGVKPFVGRVLEPTDDRPGAPPVAWITHACWTRVFGQDRTLVGRAIRLNGMPVTVVGIGPAGFHGDLIPDVAEIFVPFAASDALTLAEDPRSRRRLDVGTEPMVRLFGRLAPGVAPEVAKSRFSGLQVQRIDGKLVALQLNPWRWFKGAALLERIRWAVQLLPLLVLAITCANLASLFLTRGIQCRSEFATRAALGASRLQSAQGILAEAGLLSGLGTILALILMPFLVELLRALLPVLSQINAPLEARIDGRAVLFASALAVLSAVLCAIVPALLATRQDLVSVVKEGVNVQGGSRSRSVFLAAQVAACFVILTVAALSVRSQYALLTASPGFETAAKVVWRVGLDRRESPEKLATWNRELVAGLAGLPGIRRVTAAASLPGLSESGSTGVVALPDGKGRMSISVLSGQPDLRQVLGLGLLRGRDLLPGEQGLAIVTRSFADQMWPDGDPIGRTIDLGEEPIHVVGVVSDLAPGNRRAGIQPTLFVPWSGSGPGNLAKPWIILDTNLPPAVLAPLLREAGRAAIPGLHVGTLRTYSDELLQDMAPEQSLTRLLLLLGGLAAFISACGIFSLTAHAAVLRYREVGLRMALGASAGSILLLLARQGLKPVVAGVVVGLGMAAGVSVLARGLWFGITPTDPLSLISAAGLFVVLALGASVFPAIRAVRASSAAALREQ